MDPWPATDADFEGVQFVIAHEYFHNWMGNRVTCRDWFQLTLKEGLTVFRHQQVKSGLGEQNWVGESLRALVWRVSLVRGCGLR